MSARTLLTAVVTMLVIPVAHAGGGGGGIVFDPTNWIQTSATAASTVKQEGIAVQNAARMAKMVIDSGKMVQGRSLGITDMTQAVQLAQQLGKLAGADDALLNAIGNKQTYINDVIALYGASKSGDFTTFVNSIGQRANLGNANAKNLLTQHDVLNAAIQVAQGKRLQIASEMGSVPGVTQAVQVATAALDTLIEQNQVQASALAAQLAAAAKREAMETASRTNADSQMADYATATRSRLRTLGITP